MSGTNLASMDMHLCCAAALCCTALRATDAIPLMSHCEPSDPSPMDHRPWTTGLGPYKNLDNQT